MADAGLAADWVNKRIAAEPNTIKAAPQGGESTQAKSSHSPEREGSGPAGAAPGSMPKIPAFTNRREEILWKGQNYDALQSKLSAAYAAVRDLKMLPVRPSDTTLKWIKEWAKKHAATIAAAGEGKK